MTDLCFNYKLENILNQMKELILFILL